MNGQIYLNLLITSIIFIMRAVLQRVSSASVTINGKVKSAVSGGLLVLLGITHTDTEEDAEWLCRKIAAMRIFSDAAGLMNLSVKDTSGDILLVSQFTLFASTKKGNRPSFTQSAPPAIAIPLYQKCAELLHKETGKEIKTGEFGADMKVELQNDGPVTILLDSKNKE